MVPGIKVESLDAFHDAQEPMQYFATSSTVLANKVGAKNQPGLKTYNIGDTELRKNLNLTRATTYNEAKKDKSLNQPFIYYDDSVFTSVDQLPQTLRTKASVDKEKSRSIWRFLTKHRSVVSTVWCYGDGYGNDIKPPLFLTVTTGCMPNFMHDQADVNFYLQNNFLIPRKDKKEKFDARNNKIEQYELTTDGIAFYKNQLKLQFRRWLYIQNNQGVQVVIFPMVGGGVYLKQLNENSQFTARNLIHESLVEALQEFNTEFRTQNKKPTIEEVIYTLPDNNDNSNDFKKASQATDTLEFKVIGNDAHLTIANGDIFEIAKIVAATKKKIGFINPGSDRTIGGDFEHCLSKKGSEIVPLEETICHLTNLIREQTFEANKNDLKKYITNTFPDHLKIKNPKEIAEIKKIQTKFANNINSNPNPSTTKKTTLQASDSNFSSKWSTQAMKAANNGNDWNALQIKDQTKIDGTLKGKSAQNTEITIASNAIAFEFKTKDLNTEVEAIKSALRLLIAGKNGSDYIKLDNKNITKLKLTPTEDSDPNEVSFIQAIARTAGFDKFIEVAPMPVSAPVKSETLSDDSDDENNNNNTTTPSSSKL